MARLIVPGPDPLTFLQTVLLGIIGSYVGGILGYLIFDTDTDEGLIQTAGRRHNPSSAGPERTTHPKSDARYGP